MKKGSYTVEAALLMGILIPLLTGVIYLGFFMELRGQVQAEAMEKALTGLLTEEEAEGVSLGKKEILLRSCRLYGTMNLYRYEWENRNGV